MVFQDFLYDEKLNEFPIPSYWKNNVHTRVIRGAIEKFVWSINSAISNYKNGNIKNFNFKFKTKKSKQENIFFEDSGYPKEINKIKSVYWYRNNERKRVKISFKDIKLNKGCEIIHDKQTNQYFLYTPVPVNWFPINDLRCDNQAKYNLKGERLIALDPGVRKFMVGYDPSGTISIIGKDAYKKISSLILEIDKNKKYSNWDKVKNLINELHWKVISYLVENYDIILLPSFEITNMIKGRKLLKITKRLLMMFSYYKFKEKLIYKCKVYNKKLYIVDESYTSKTCSNCFTIKTNLGGSEVFKCKECNIEYDRDVGASRNILIKNLGYA